MALAVAISVGVATHAAGADTVDPDGKGTSLVTVVKVLAQPDRGTPQVGLGIVAGAE